MSTFGKRSPRSIVALKNLAFSYANVAFALISGILLVPVYFKYFDASIYGSFLAVFNIINIVNLSETGLSFTTTRLLAEADAQQNESKFHLIYRTAQATASIYAAITVLFGVLVINLVPYLTGTSGQQGEKLQLAFAIGIIALVVSIFNSILSSAAQAKHLPSQCGAANLISSICGIFTTLAGLSAGLQVLAIACGYLAKNLTSLLTLFLLSKKTTRQSLQTASGSKGGLKTVSIKGLFLTSLPVAFNSTSKGLVSNLQLTLIIQLADQLTAAKFALSSRIFLFVSTVVAPVGSSVFSTLSQLKTENAANRLNLHLRHLLELVSFTTASLLATAFVFNEAFLNLLIGPGKYVGNEVALLICCATYFNSRIGFLSVSMIALGGSRKTAIAEQIANCAKILCIWLMVPVLNYAAIPASEAFIGLLTTIIAIRWLAIHTLKLGPKESLRFALTGISAVVLCVIQTWAWVKYIAPPTTWFGLAVSSATFITVNTISATAVSSNLRAAILAIISVSRLQHLTAKLNKPGA